MFVSYPDREYLDYLLFSATKERVKVILVTDGERILGLGDQGTGDGLLPDLAGIQELSRRIAFDEARQAQKEGVALRPYEDTIRRSIERNFWRPRYRRYLRRAM